VAHLPRGDALEVAFGEGEQERLFVALIAGEDGRREQPAAVARHAQREAADAGDECAGAGPVAQPLPLGGALVGLGAEVLGELALEHGLHDGLDELAQRVGIGAKQGERWRHEAGLLEQAARATIHGRGRSGHRSSLLGSAERQLRR